MQRFGLLLGIFLILTGLTYRDGGLRDIYPYCADARVCFYLTASESLNFDAYSGDIFVVKNGNGVIVDAPADAALRLRRGLSGMKGESVSFDGGYGDALEIIRLYRVKVAGGEILPLDEENSVRIIYGYSRFLTKSVSLDGKNINIQIAVNAKTGKVTAGTPLILGSY